MVSYWTILPSFAPTVQMSNSSRTHRSTGSHHGQGADNKNKSDRILLSDFQGLQPHIVNSPHVRSKALTKWGSPLDDLKVERELAQGTFGVVYVSLNLNGPTYTFVMCIMGHLFRVANLSVYRAIYTYRKCLVPVCRQTSPLADVQAATLEILTISTTQCLL